MLTISLGVLVFRSFSVWGWFSHALLLNLPHKTVWRLAYCVHQVLAVSQYNEWDPNSCNDPMCAWRRQARLRCKWEDSKNTVLLLRLAVTSILFFVCHKRCQFQESELLLILKEFIYFVIFNSGIFFYRNSVRSRHVHSELLQAVHHTDSTSPILTVRTRHMAAVYITPQTLKITLKLPVFYNYPLLSYIILYYYYSKLKF